MALGRRRVYALSRLHPCAYTEGMRLAVLLLIASCSSANSSDAVRADVEIMCGAAKATGGKTFMDVGPHIAENMKTELKVELFEDARTSTLDEIIARMRGLMAKANVTQCDTVDVLIANDPRKKPAD